MNRRRSRSRGHLSLLALVLVFALLALGCPSSGGGSDGGAGAASGTSGAGSGGGGTPTATCGNGSVESGETCDDGNTNPGDSCSATCQTETPPAPVCGNGDLEAGESCDDGNTNPGDGCSATCQTEPPPPPSGSAAVENVQSTAEWREGPTLTMSNYVVPGDGLLVVRIGAHAGVSDSVTFAGEEMIHVSSVEVTYSTTTSVEMFYLPVTAGESGAIVVDYVRPGTDQRGMVVSTLTGVDTIELFQNSNGGGPNLAQDTVTTTRANSVILSAFTDFGDGIPEEVGTAHVLDGYPTVPETDYHEMKLQTGHVDASSPGDYTLGFQNTRATGYMDYALILAVFSDGS
ncbi:MAG: DUF4215 domain-containing protein [Myxococcota bacterium]